MAEALALLSSVLSNGTGKFRLAPMATSPVASPTIKLVSGELLPTYTGGDAMAVVAVNAPLLAALKAAVFFGGTSYASIISTWNSAAPPCPLLPPGVPLLVGAAGQPGLCSVTGIMLSADGSVLYIVEGLQPAACHTDIKGHPLGMSLAFSPQSLRLPVS